MSSRCYGVVLFESTTAALKAEKEAVRAELKIKLVPVPRQLSSECGFCLRFEWLDMEKVEGLLRDRNLKFESIEKLS
jgi:hypothetical protein